MNLGVSESGGPEYSTLNGRIPVIGTPKKGTPSFRIVNPKKLETGLRTISAGIPYTWLLRIEAIGFPSTVEVYYGLIGCVFGRRL